MVLPLTEGQYNSTQPNLQKDHIVIVCCTKHPRCKGCSIKNVGGGGGGGGGERKVFWRGEGPNSELIYPIRLH